MSGNVVLCGSVGITLHKITHIIRSGFERELGILVSADLRSWARCIEAKIRANRVLSFITRSLTNRIAEVILKVHLA